MNTLPLLQAWPERISDAWRAGVEAVIRTGQLLAEAKAALAHGEFEAMIERELPFGPSTARRLMIVAADARIANRAHGHFLPPSWRTLYELTKLDDDAFRARLADGTIRPDMERAQATAIVRKAPSATMHSRAEPDDSLDYFPTPPWATRALFEVVLPSARFARPTSIWEPACGEGHMAEVCAEYCSDVFASDVHDYGYGDVLDFRSCEPPARRSWIITNPPFGDRAIEFVLRARSLTDLGVAMFFRSQWIVEGVDRYERLFRDAPPAIIAFFSERVPLHKGRWEPDGSTLTAYCWAIWMIDAASPIDGATRVMWIPPGCRERLTKPDDVDRFTARPVKRRITLELAAGGAEADEAAVAPRDDSAPEPSDDGLEIPSFLRREVIEIPQSRKERRAAAGVTTSPGGEP